VITGSVVDLVFNPSSPTDPEAVNAAVREAAEGHAVFGDEEGQFVTGEVLDEEGEAFGEHVPVPPFAGHRREHPTPRRPVLEFMIPKHRQSKGMRREGIIIIEADVIEHAPPGRRIEVIEK